MTVTYSEDFESYGTGDEVFDRYARTDALVTVAENTPNPYAGLNRAQRRKAMSVENRAWRKQGKRRV